MYRRLKNLLGVSLIILAIVLSQLPMGAVQADTTSQEGVESTNETPYTEASMDENSETKELELTDGNLKSETTELDGNNIISEGAKTTDGSEEGEEQKLDNASAEEEEKNTSESNNNIAENNLNTANVTENDELVNEPVLIDGDTLSDSETTIKHKVTFDYGFKDLEPTVLDCEVNDGLSIDVEWEITDDDGKTKLEEGQIYTIEKIPYFFKGWYKTAECKDGEYWEKEYAVDEDKDLFAKWEYAGSGGDTAVIIIKFIAGDSEEETQIVSLDAGKRLILSNLEKPRKEGSDFKTWEEEVGDGENRDTKEIDWNEIPIRPRVFKARWESTKYTVTFNANGGKFNGSEASTTKTEWVYKGNSISEYPEIDQDSYQGNEVDLENWYTDKECLNIYDKATSSVTSNLTLYKKWTHIDKGFMLSADGTVLYKFNGDQSEVVIPSTVRTIASEAFPDVDNIKSITLPAGIADIKENAFSGATDWTETIYIYSSSQADNDSKMEGENLAAKYECFEYVATGGNGENTNVDSIILDDVTCNLNEVNKGIDDNSAFVYPKVTLPIDLPNGKYQVLFTELNTPTTIKALLESAGYNLNSGYVYYMDISMKKLGELEGYKPVWSTGKMSITMPLPVSWYGRNTDNIRMLTVNRNGKTLEPVEISEFNSNLVTFHPEHFSEFALVFTGSLPSGGGNDSSGGDTTPGDGSTSGGTTPGDGSTSGGTTPGGGSTSGDTTPENGSASGDSSSGDSSSGSSSSSGGGSSSGSSSSGGSSSTGSNAGSSVTPTVTTPTVAPNIPLVTPAPIPGTQPTISTPTGTTGGSAGGTTAHVKDSTPKTGDPLEYRSILVCSFFSIGVLLLLIGNKKKTSSSSRCLRA